ncbi:hypothetical protein DLP3_095 [Stenotrophomonas phage vB_SmaS_DLP_3]|nr:hypothetical protein DLP3_095 [Stenotrophomonas phage vB_SmaS_DLP_3]
MNPFRNPVFVVALIATALYLVFGLSIFFGSGSGLISWILGVVFAVVVVALWVAYARGATNYRQAKDEVGEKWDEIRDRYDKDEK